MPPVFMLSLAGHTRIPTMMHEKDVKSRIAGQVQHLAIARTCASTIIFAAFAAERATEPWPHAASLGPQSKASARRGVHYQLIPIVPWFQKSLASAAGHL